MLLAPFLLALALGSAVPQAVDSPPNARPTVEASTIDESAPVAVPEPSELAMRYYNSGNVLWIVEQVWSVAVMVLLLATGFSARMRDVAKRVGRNWFFTIVVYFVLFTVLTAIIDLPLSYYTEYVREHAYGLSNQT